MTTGLPFDDFRTLIGALPGPDRDALAKARAHSKATGADALGRLGSIAEWYAAWSGKAVAPATRPLVAVFAGNHGIAASGAGPWSVSETAARVELCAAGGAAVNQICVSQDIGLRVFDLALDLPTGDIRSDAALDERGCAATMAYGMEAIAGGTDLLALGDLGAGNPAVAGALLAAILGGAAEDWAGDAKTEEGAARLSVISSTLETHRGHLGDPLEALRRVGGREFAAIAGAILATRVEKVPVVLGGYAVTAAAAVLYKANPAALDHCLLADITDEPGHAFTAKQLGLSPLFDYRIAIAEGASAALGAGLVKTALQCHTEMVGQLPVSSD